MTEDQSKLLSVFEGYIRRLMDLCNAMKLKNNELEKQLAELKLSYDELEEENKTIKVRYDNLKMMKIIIAREGDFKETKDRLSGLVKEVDKCIALLNE